MKLSPSFLEHFAVLEDPRRENHRNKKHLLSDILVVTILVVICGAESWVDVENFGHCKKRWLKTFLELPNGIPSQDTIGRVFSLLDAKQLQTSFLSWINSLVSIVEYSILLNTKTPIRIEMYLLDFQLPTNFDIENSF